MYKDSARRSVRGGYLLSHFRSIIDVVRFNFSVRNGKRWRPHAMAALSSFSVHALSHGPYKVREVTGKRRSLHNLRDSHPSDVSHSDAAGDCQAHPSCRFQSDARSCIAAKTPLRSCAVCRDPCGSSVQSAAAGFLFRLFCFPVSVRGP